jgi:hypothetical protein
MLFKQVLAKRRLIQRNRVASDREIMRNANMPEYRTVLIVEKPVIAPLGRAGAVPLTHERLLSDILKL